VRPSDHTVSGVRRARGWSKLIPATLALLASAPAAVAAGSAGSVTELWDVLARPAHFDGNLVTVRGTVTDPELARAPEGYRGAFALTPPNSDVGLCVIAGSSPPVGQYAEVTGVACVNPTSNSPYMMDPSVTVLHELPIWQRPFDRQALWALGAILAFCAAVMLFVSAARMSREPGVRSPEAYRRALAAALVRPAQAPEPLAQGLVPSESAEMPTVVLEARSGPDAGRRFVVRKARVSIGRHADRDIALTDNSLSRYEASILRQNGSVRVRAESPSAIMSVNAHPIGDAAIRPSDVIRLGSTELVVVATDDGHDDQGSSGRGTEAREADP